MWYRMSSALVATAVLTAPLAAQQSIRVSKETSPEGEIAPPALAREFRGVWIATVANMDWPSRRGLSTAQQKSELIAMLDRAAGMRLNGIVFQVRPAADALYDSPYEPWSEVLTGRQGQRPDPYYDPLAFAVEQAHKRGLELHAWFNPYRARFPSMRSPLTKNHVTRTHASWVRQYGTQVWLDPGLDAVRENTKKVIIDVVRRYDIDGVHLDDYFYPYREADRRGRMIEFPDEGTWKAYRQKGGSLDRGDWRRENVNRLVRELNDEVHAAKPWVKFGISPFGIWRPGNPPSVRGLDSYTEIFADSRKWIREGWADYFAPQLYWSLDRPEQSYTALMEWWVSQNSEHRNLWIGNYTSRVRNGESRTNWPADEVLNQIRLTRSTPGASGNIHFSMEVLMKDRDRISTRLANGLYASPALVPATPWLVRTVPAMPDVTAKLEPSQVAVTLGARGSEPVRWWVVQMRIDDQWYSTILTGSEKSVTMLADRGPPDLLAVTAVSRTGIESRPRVLRLR